MESEDKYLVVSVTVPEQQTADTIATALLSARLAACVQVHPIVSHYRWEGELQREDELMLTIKTTADRYPELERVILGIHPYEVPEIVAVPIVAGSEDYLRWVAAESRPAIPQP